MPYIQNGSFKVDVKAKTLFVLGGPVKVRKWAADCRERMIGKRGSLPIVIMSDENGDHPYCHVQGGFRLSERTVIDQDRGIVWQLK